MLEVARLPARSAPGMWCSSRPCTATCPTAAVLGDPAIEAVSLALPNFAYAEVIPALIAAGKHVLAEKPLGHLWGGERILLLAVGVAVSQLAARARRLKVITITDAGYLAQIHESAALAQSAASAQAVVDHVRSS